MTFRVTVLGSSSALPTSKRNPSAHALNVHEQFFLIDCGEGTQKLLRKEGINPLKLNAVFITHLHGDHLFGLFPLLSTMSLLGRGTPLKIYAPRPFDEILAGYFKYFDPNPTFAIEWCEVETRKHQLLFENKTLEVYSIPLRHRIPSAGFLFKEKTPSLNLRKEIVERYGLGIAQCVAAKRGEDITLENGDVLSNGDLTYLPYSPRSYAYLSDTQYSAKAAELVQGVNLLYHEATFLEADKSLARSTGHSTALQAARVAEKARAERLLIGHFSARYADEGVLVEEARTVFPNTESVTEGASYDIPLLNPNNHKT